MITSKKFLKQKKISHGFFNRNGGNSHGIYKSLNCGLGSNDKIERVKKNLEIVKNKISKKSKNIFLVNQTHSSKFLYINKNRKLNLKKIKADAIVTDQKKLPIAVLTADCAPILLYDKKRNMVAAIHAGWKGALKGIVLNVINFMLSKGCRRRNLIAAIGPCIGPRNYKIKEDLRKKFLQKDKNNSIFFRKRENKIYFDLPNYIKSQLKFNKITNIDMKNIDTFVKRNNFFSARRALKSKHVDYGRNISIIMIN